MSPHKLAAVRQACDVMEIAAEIRGVKAPFPVVAAQPFGHDEIVRGAEHRATAVDAEGYDLAIGIESGVFSAFSLRLMYFDAAAVVLCAQGRIVGISLTTGVVFPVEFVHEALKHGSGRTVGEVMREATGCDATDGTSFLTGGRYSRVDQIAAGVIAAFAQARIP